MGLMNNGMAAPGLGMTQQIRPGEKEPSSPHPKHLIHSLKSGALLPRAGPVNSSPNKWVCNKVYCKAIITWSSLADLWAGHTINPNWLLSPAWGHSEILHPLVVYRFTVFMKGLESFLPPSLSLSLPYSSSFFPSFVTPSTHFFI